MRLIASFLILASSCFGSENSDWFNQVKTRIDQDAVEWLRKEIQNDGSKIDLSAFSQQPCKNCYFLGGLFNMEPKLYIFMSFSMPDETWLALAKEMKAYAGVFVMQGLPENSFQQFAKRVVDLKAQGMDTDIHINPLLFKKFKVKETPTFAIYLPSDPDSDSAEGKILKISVYSGIDDFDSISGNISLKYALDTMANNSKYPESYRDRLLRLTDNEALEMAISN